MQSLVQSIDYFHFLLHIICGLELTEPFDVVQYYRQQLNVQRSKLCRKKKPLKTFTNFISEKISVEVGTSIPNGEMFLYFQVYRRFRAIYWKTF